MLGLVRATYLSVMLVFGIGVNAAQAATLPLTFGGDTVLISLNDIFDTGIGSVAAGVFTHDYKFTPTEDLTAISTTIQFAPPAFDVGIAGLTMAWAGGPALVLTNAAGEDLDPFGAHSISRFLALAAGTVILTISGSGLDNGGNYQLFVQAVPVPAALPLFGTGLGILGFLGWRRRRKLSAQATA